MSNVQKVILDTDIGDDIDDALALALICASPELELLGVTTVFGNVVARARQARTVLAVSGGKFRNIPVAAGCGAGLSTRPAHGVRSRQDFLENVLPNQDASCLPEAELAPLHVRHGVDFLIETLLAGAGDIVPIMIGAMTNLAMAMVKAPRIIAKIPRIVAMAGEFHTPLAEWNIRCDPEAAEIVFGSGIPIDVTPWTIGRIVQFDDSHIARLNHCRSPMTRNLSHAIACYQERHSSAEHRAMPALYDPMAVATMIRPDLVTWKSGTVSVELRGEHTYGYTPFAENSAGIHRVAWNADRERSLTFYLQRVLAM